MMAGAAAGAAVSVAVAGPVGVVLGGALGGIAGALGGAEVGTAIDTAIDTDGAADAAKSSSQNSAKPPWLSVSLQAAQAHKRHNNSVQRRRGGLASRSKATCISGVREKGAGSRGAKCLCLHLQGHPAQTVHNPCTPQSPCPGRRVLAFA